MNPTTGRNIQAVATVFFVINLIVVWIVALVLMAAFGSSSNDSGPIGFLIGLAVGGVGTFFAWVGKLLLVGYGKITEASELQIQEKIASGAMPVASPTPGAATEAAARTPMPSVAGTKCPQCGTALALGAKFCPKCGNPMAQ